LKFSDRRAHAADDDDIVHREVSSLLRCYLKAKDLSNCGVLLVACLNLTLLTRLLRLAFVAAKLVRQSREDNF